MSSRNRRYGRARRERLRNNPLSCFEAPPASLDAILRRIHPGVHLFDGGCLTHSISAPLGGRHITLTARRLERIWGGIVGKRFHALLHGEDLPSPPRQKRSLGHEHVLAPEQRYTDTAKTVLQELLVKAALRLRQENLYCRRLVVNIKWTADDGYWSDDRTFTESQDNLLFNRVLLEIWKKVPRKKPLRVGVSLTDLVEATQHQQDLFDKPQNESLTKAIDQLNEKFGKGAIGFGLAGSSSKKLTSKIAFQRVPDLSEF